MWNVEPAQGRATRSGCKAVKLLASAPRPTFRGGIAARGAAMASALTRNALRFLGVPYSFGARPPPGSTVPGTSSTFSQMMGRHVPRTADAQYYAAQPIAGWPQPGDLVFFQTTPRAAHVGISLGGDRFVHASSSHGVTVSSLHESYWSARYLGAKRIVE